jgi:NADPH-dependent glutamate synthase beta subunit-like oxidoreductase
MLVLGLPAYRLPREKFEKELDVFRAMGINFETNMKLGRDMTLADLRDKGYMAVYVAVGAHSSRKVGVEGEDLENVIPGVDFLRAVNLGRNVDMKGKKVAVIGGGNVAIDCARVAVRTGAETVDLFCLEKAYEMPAHKWEVKEAVEEGVNIQCSWGPLEFKGSEGAVKKVVMKKCLSVFDKRGNFRPSFDDSHVTESDADVVIVAIGQMLDDSFRKVEEFEIPKRGDKLDAKFDGRTAIPYVYTGGDCVTGPDSVVGGVKYGKEAASSIDRYLGGDGQIIDIKTFKRELTKEIDETPAKREEMPKRAASERKCSFEEVEKGFSEDQVVREAARCLRCDVLKVKESRL